MTMSCPTPESELLVFHASGSLPAAEAAAVEEHVAQCEACRDDLAHTRAMIRDLGALHLTPEEVVAAAWGDPQPAHLAECPRCRDEVALVRGVTLDLEASPVARRRPAAWLPWAAAVLLAVPAGLYVREVLLPEAPVTRGPEDRAPALAVDAVVGLASGASTTVPRSTVLLSFPCPAPGPGGRVEAELRGPAGQSALRVSDLAVAGGRGMIVVDVRALAAGPWQLALQGFGPTGAAQPAVTYDLRVP